MWDAFLAGAVAYISTNLDDLAILTVVTSANKNIKLRHMMAGRFMGIGLLTAVSLLGAFGLSFVPQQYVGLLGFVPMALGVKSLLSKDEDGENAPGGTSAAVHIAVLTVANGADNIGVYIPLFAGFSLGQNLLVTAVFAILTLLYCFLTVKLAHLPRLHSWVQRYKGIAVPVVLIGLGVYILLKAYVL